jgi:autotransporter-associated beta strand protein
LGAHAGGAALLGTNGSGTVMLKANDPNYLNVLILDNSNSSYTLAAPTGGTLTFTGVDLSGANTGSSIVEVVCGSHSITAPVDLEGATDITGFDPAAMLSIAGAVSGTGSLTLAGSGTLVLSSSDNSFSGGMTVEGGTLILADVGALDSSALTIGADATSIFASAGPTMAVLGDGAVAASVPEPATLALLAAMTICSAAVWLRKGRFGTGTPSRPC